MSSEIIPNSIISFISAKFTQIPGVLIATGKPAWWRPELVGENGNANTGSRNRVVSWLSARFPVLKWRSRPLAKSLYYCMTQRWADWTMHALSMNMWVLQQILRNDVRKMSFKVTRALSCLKRRLKDLWSVDDDVVWFKLVLHFNNSCYLQHLKLLKCGISL